MVNFLKLQYKMGRITIEQLEALVVQGRILQEDLDFIIM